MLNMTLVNMANKMLSIGHAQMLTDSATTDNIKEQAWFTTLIKGIKDWVTPLLILACAAGAVWAIILGVKMAQADDKSKRDEAKANLINVVIALVAVIALILIFTIVGDAVLENGLDTTAAPANNNGSGSN